MNRFKLIDFPFIQIFVLFGMTLLTQPANASFGFKFDGTLDKSAISKAYFEGDFHRILPPLETWRTSRATKSRDDSIFVYKYLSVIYAADSTTMNKAESFMVQLIKLMPTIELVDMYISDNIEAIFKNVQEKYLKQQHYVRHHDELGRTLQDSTTVNEKEDPRIAKYKQERPSKWIWWTVGGVGMAVAVSGGYYVLHGAPSSSKTKSFEP